MALYPPLAGTWSTPAVPERPSIVPWLPQDGQQLHIEVRGLPVLERSEPAAGHHRGVELGDRSWAWTWCTRTASGVRPSGMGLSRAGVAPHSAPRTPCPQYQANPCVGNLVAVATGRSSLGLSFIQRFSSATGTRQANGYCSWCYSRRFRQCRHQRHAEFPHLGHSVPGGIGRRHCGPWFSHWSRLWRRVAHAGGVAHRCIRVVRQPDGGPLAAEGLTSVASRCP